MALRRNASPQTSSNLTPSPFESSGCPRSMIRVCGRTIELKTHTSRFDGENENSNGSNRLVQPNVSCLSTPPSRTPSMSNAIFCLAASSRIFGLRRLRSGSRAASQPDPWREPLWPTAPVNVSMPPRLSKKSDLGEFCVSAISNSGRFVTAPVRYRGRLGFSVYRG